MRITPGTMTIGILAILTGLVGAYATRSFLQKTPAPAPPPPQRTPVPLASLDLPADRELVLGDISLIPMTAEEMRERGIPFDLAMLSANQIVGRRLKRPLKQGEPFLTTSMWPQGEGPRKPTIEDLLQPGYRAIPIPLAFDDANAVEEGGLVDVLFRTDGTEGIPEMSVPLVEGARVLRISQGPVEGTFGNARVRRLTATLGVPYEDARKLEVVSGRGRLSLIARSEEDLLRGSFNKLTLADVLQLQPPQPIDPFTTEIYERGQRRINEFARSRVVAQVAPEPAGMQIVPPTPRPGGSGAGAPGTR